jgi:hypothetical protein
MNDPAVAERPTRTPAPGWADGLLVVFAAGCAVSPFAFGFYDLSVWGPISIGVLVVVLALAVARTAAPPARALVAVGGFAMLGVWAVLSRGWESRPMPRSSQAIAGCSMPPPSGSWSWRSGAGARPRC